MLVSQITDGTSLATVNMKNDKSGVTIKFDDVQTPQFIAKVGKLVDEFMWSDKTVDKCFHIDSFEKNN